MAKNDIPKAYDAKEHEEAIYAAWEASGLFNPDHLPERHQHGEPYALMMPPPNVTGVLHLGHALENAIMDTTIRFQRMRGKRTLLMPGTDHAALPTQAKVEKMLMEQGMKNPRAELGREALVEKIRAFAEQSKATILKQIRKVGTSADWSRLAYTFDEPRNKAVNELFTRMYNDGLIYRGYRVVNWSVKGQSTCSDDEVEHVERAAKIYTFKYAKDFPITIASTRPETKLGDTAVAVHPTDKRYKKFIGQTFVVDVGAAKPLTIKIIADEGVDPKFGTGALGVTPAHSAIDFATYEKQKAKGEPIDIIPVIGADGKMTAEAGAAYEGLAAEAARAKFVAWLHAEGLMEKEEEITQNVGTSDRYGDVIEAIPMTQWWLDVNKEIPGRGKTLRDLMREAVTTGLNGDASQKVTITPDRFTKLYLDRVENLRDWCLSRQIWWGHRIPVWYRGEEIQVGAEKPSGDGWEQDPDTLDTWFSSGSWTFSTLGWPEETASLTTFHPTSFMQMGYEILYLWLMRMILMSAYALNEIPFKDAYIHGILRDANGKKFSKSSGNGIDPIEVIEVYGADALRISLLLGISPGNDSRYYTEKIESGRNFTNKLWNIARFVLTTVENVETVETVETRTLADKWILGRLSEVTKKVTEHLGKHEFSAAGELLRDFTWSDFADWYLEIAKLQKSENTNRVLLYALRHLLKLWHPFMPFVTEAIWREHFSGDGFLMVEQWPETSVAPDEKAVRAFALIQDVVTVIRNLRAEHKVEPKMFVDVTLVDAAWAELLTEQKEVIKGLGRIKELSVDATGGEHPGSAAATAGTVQIFMPLVGLIDTGKERTRLLKELTEAQAYVTSLHGKLENKEFVNKAPAAVIEKIRTNLRETNDRVLAIESQLAGLSE